MSLSICPQARPAAIFAPLLVGLVILFSGSVANSGPGHDHGNGTSAVEASPASPRLVAESDKFELVGILKNGALTVYLDRRQDTSPVLNATIELLMDGESHIAEPTPEGVYRVVSPKLVEPGEREVIITIAHEGAADLLVGVLGESGAHNHDQGHDHSGAEGSGAERAPGAFLAALQTAGLANSSSCPASITILTLLGAGMMLGVFLGASLRWRKGLGVAATLFAILFGADMALAGPGHDHGGEAAQINGDAPQRLADGAIFLPKSTQRLLQIRTRILLPEETRTSRKLVGRVIADPNRAGLVQSTIGGRVRLAENGLPLLGQTVVAGDVLAYVEPAFAPIDASDVRQTGGDLEQQIALVEARIKRQKELVARSVSSRADLEDLEIELSGLEARRKLLAESRSKPEPLIAPVGGVVASVDVVAGQVVAAGHTLFKVVDPSRLWIEALSYDPNIAIDGDGVSARLPSGERFGLAYVGRSRTLRQQAVRLHFRIENPTEKLHIGSPIKVEVETGEPVRGIIVNRKAIAQAPNGQTVVFKRLAPERYEPVAIAFDDVDLDRVRITGGLQAKDQIIVRAAQLVNQIR